MKFIHYLVLFCIFIISGCTTNETLTLKGTWIKEPNGKAMLDPQTSGLTFWRGKLLSISDGSADISQRKQLHIIDPLTAKLAGHSLTMIMSERVKQSCFAAYLADSPDLEALAVDPNDDNVFIVVTEDATRSDPLTDACQKRFANSGSTDFPTVLLRLVLIDENTVEITHAKPIQFDDAFNVGNFPNDGIEGLTFDLDNTLYLALEKDAKGQARIFSVKINEDFWLSDNFTRVQDTQVSLPKFNSQHHPINAIAYIPKEDNQDHKGYLVAAARNDNQLWLIDLMNQQPTKVIYLDFLAPTEVDASQCSPWELIDNTSIEGAVFYEGTLWLVNDPWKKHYLENIQCESNRKRYQEFSPLLFSMPVTKNWF